MEKSTFITANVCPNVSPATNIVSGYAYPPFELTVGLIPTDILPVPSAIAANDSIYFVPSVRMLPRSIRYAERPTISRLYFPSS